MGEDDVVRGAGQHLVEQPRPDRLVQGGERVGHARRARRRRTARSASRARPPPPPGPAPAASAWPPAPARAPRTSGARAGSGRCRRARRPAARPAAPGVQRVAVGVVAQAPAGLGGQRRPADRARQLDDLLGVEPAEPDAVHEVVLRQAALPPRRLGRCVVARRDHDEDLVAAQPSPDEHERARRWRRRPTGRRRPRRPPGPRTAARRARSAARRPPPAGPRPARAPRRAAARGAGAARRRRAGPAPRTGARSRPRRRRPTARRRRRGRRGGGGRARSSRCPRDRSATGHAAARPDAVELRAHRGELVGPADERLLAGHAAAVCRRGGARGTGVTAWERLPPGVTIGHRPAHRTRWHVLSSWHRALLACPTPAPRELPLP